MSVSASITSVNCFVPDYVLTNKELEQLVDTNDEWIKSRTGITKRHILKDKNKAASYMGAEAVKGLLKKSNTSPNEIDLVICATVTPDMMFPATSNLIAFKSGIKKAFAFDLNAACSGFIYALHTASSYIKSGLYKKVIVVGSDKMSSIVDYTDRTTCILFGDAAGAVLLEADESGNGIIDAVMETDGAGEDFLFQKAGGSLNPASIETVLAKEHYIYQEGKTVFKIAVTKLAEVSEKIIKRNNLNADTIDWLVPHQANNRIINAMKNRMDLPDEKVMVNIDRYGNTTNATIPLCLWEWEEKLKKGDNLILAAFGGGFTWGALYLKWAYNKKEII